LGLKFTEGALVTKVQSDSMADRAGVEVGDVIVKVGQQSVKNVDELKKALEKLDSASGIVMTVRNSEGSRIVYLEQ
jgi:serine protease Do